ncbi:MAG: protein-export chaperone SecB [Nevskiaceae bacterium]|jgi:preprotein translocase subunit SecB|nr:MAG: protein-export chaperone SecB [Nevskiaceae bacterium]TAM23030.1 MAG: protein-export chaperone SecB [Nevskiaceae bacterium]
MTDTAAPQTAPATGPQVLLQKIYLKDASIEIPQAPAIFARTEQPAIDIALNTNAQNVGNDNFQVTLSVTVTAKLPTGETAFLIEAHQAGIFTIRGFENPADVEGVLGVFCPNTIFPFARESVADLMQRAGFSPVLLQPVNFEALFIEHRNRRATAAAAPAAVAH